MTARIASNRLKVLGMASALPGPSVSTDELLKCVASRFGIPISRIGQRIVKSLGINTRHLSRDLIERIESPRPGCRNPELAARATAAAIKQANKMTHQMGYLLSHTTTPGRLLPPNAAEVAQLLNFTSPFAEFRQACTGFANALQFAAGMLHRVDAPPVAIVGSETGSVFFDPLAVIKDAAQWVNLVQMGDGAGAIILGPDDGQAGAYIETIFFGHIGLGHAPGFELKAGGSDQPGGYEIATFRHDYKAIEAYGPKLFDAGMVAVQKAGIELDKIDYILPHQANGRMAEWLAPRLGVNIERIVGNGAEVGNLGSAAIWVALDTLRRSGRLQVGQRLLVLGAEATQYSYGGFVYVHG
jgi:3-oxoacyl-[acyl-carrier-protein] synthase III